MGTRTRRGPHDPDDIADGERLLELVPTGVRAFVRRGGYLRGEYTHELVAET
jgi:hypothetical protein